MSLENTPEGAGDTLGSTPKKDATSGQPTISVEQFLEVLRSPEGRRIMAEEANKTFGARSNKEEKKERARSDDPMRRVQELESKLAQKDINNAIDLIIAKNTITMPDVFKEQMQKHVKYENDRVYGLNEYGEEVPVDKVAEMLFAKYPAFRPARSIQGTAEPGSNVRSPASHTIGNASPSEFQSGQIQLNGKALEERFGKEKARKMGLNSNG